MARFLKSPFFASHFSTQDIHSISWPRVLFPLYILSTTPIFHAFDEVLPLLFVSHSHFASFCLTEVLSAQPHEI
jgi:hypothetical protein